MTSGSPFSSTERPHSTTVLSTTESISDFFSDSSTKTSPPSSTCDDDLELEIGTSSVVSDSVTLDQAKQPIVRDDRSWSIPAQLEAPEEEEDDREEYMSRSVKSLRSVSDHDDSVCVTMPNTTEGIDDYIVGSRDGAKPAGTVTRRSENSRQRSRKISAIVNGQELSPGKK